jgi:S-layer protein
MAAVVLQAHCCEAENLLILRSYSMATVTAASATDIQTLYVAYFNRPADPLGLQAWLSTGASIATIAAGFSASQEYKDTYGGKSPLDLVDSIYMNLFGRHAEAAGLVYWAGKLQAGTRLSAASF